jgi:hypothetical protein
VSNKCPFENSITDLILQNNGFSNEIKGSGAEEK